MEINVMYGQLTGSIISQVLALFQFIFNRNGPGFCAFSTCFSASRFPLLYLTHSDLFQVSSWAAFLHSPKTHTGIEMHTRPPLHPHCTPRLPGLGLHQSLSLFVLTHTFRSSCRANMVPPAPHPVVPACFLGGLSPVASLVHLCSGW